MTIPALIDKQDTVEQVRDQVAAILALESASQVSLATAAGKPDPSLWALRVYQERSNPWDNLPAADGTDTPVVNVWWDSSDFDKSSSNAIERQKSAAVINIDCFAYGQSAADGSGGQITGDRSAAEAAQRAVRLVRNILMAAEYTYLGLRGTVWGRWIDSINMMQPQQDNQTAEHIVGARVALRVEFNEFSPQVPTTTLEILTVGVHRAEDGQLVADTEFDYPL